MNKIITSYENKIIYEDFISIYSQRSYWNELNGKSILVTGAYGSIARYLVYYLFYLKKECNIKIEIILNGRNKEKMNYYYSNYSSLFQAIYDDISFCVENLPNKIDFVFHAASNARPELFSKYPIETIFPNVFALNNLLAKYKKAKFLYFSTGSIYGNCTDSVITEDSIGIINHFDIMSSYAESKRLGELLCKSYYVENGVDARVVRIHHTYGPTIDINLDSRSFSYFIKCAINNENIVLNSSGNTKRSFLYVSDAILAFFDILFFGSGGEAYNLSGNSFIKIIELAKLITKLNGRISVSINKDNNVFDNNSNRLCMSSVKKLEKIGWKQKVSIEEGFYRTIESFKCNNE